MARVTISVNGHEYGLACDDGQEARIRAAGALLDERVGELAGRIGRTSDLNLVVMAGVTLADEAIGGGSDSPVEGELEALAEALERLAEQAEALASRLAPS